MRRILDLLDRFSLWVAAWLVWKIGFWLFPRFRQRRLILWYQRGLLGDYAQQPRQRQALFNQKIGRAAIRLGGASLWFWMALQQMLLLSPHTVWLLLLVALFMVWWLAFALAKLITMLML
ncbi:MAG: hypothetical protein N2690_00195 [Rhodocyclaceae bacterium]|nr:hypothetical protein [Rhodocyclaceae bacterium]